VLETPGPEALSETEVLQRVQAISDEQLDRIVERVAGVVIERLAGSILERIAWEVVPDLAEGMIKEEIRKITETSH
jgi:Glu-tRNA(Gln) amidotransferase subunit E-like FAD-binding protein